MPFLDIGQRFAGIDGQGGDLKSGVLYVLSCVALLVIAAILRFGGLAEDALWGDEYQAAENAGYTISYLIDRTRDSNSSPLLYPFILYFIQKFDVSAFSLRIVPATASFLTVAALLLLLPRVGVNRLAAFVAGSLATVSVNAVNHAQDAREYSIDTLVAVLMIAGLLIWLRDGRKRLFCTSLLVAPLLQYNLVLFGVAVFATAMVMRWISLSKEEHGPGSGWSGNVARLCKELSLPGLCFLLSCGVSAATTVHYQWEHEFGRLPEESYLRPYHYMGEYRDILSLLEFTFSATHNFLNYLLPTGVAEFAGVLIAAAAGVALVRRCRISALSTLFVFSITIAILAAAARYYPFGGFRMALYLLPILYLAVGFSFRMILDAIPASVRAGAAATVGVVVLSLGLREVTARGSTVETLSLNPSRVYWEVGSEQAQRRHAEQVWTLVEKDEGASIDVVIAAGAYTRLAALYRRMFGQNGEPVRWVRCYPQVTNMIKCFEEYARDFFPGSERPLHNRVETLLFVSGVREEHFDGEWSSTEVLTDLDEWTRFDDPWRKWDDSVPSPPWLRSRYDPLLSEHANPQSLNVDLLYPGRNLDPSGTKGMRLSLYRIENFHRYYEPALNRILRVRNSDRLLIRSSFDVYLRDERKIIYVKESCTAEDERHPFYLHIFPRDEANISKDRRDRGFESRDFPFVWHGMRYEGRCVIEIDLPDYKVARIRAGQYVRLGVGNDSMYFDVWSDEAALPDVGVPVVDLENRHLTSGVHSALHPESEIM